MRIKPIRSEEDYRAAQQRMMELLAAEPDSDEADELDVLLVLLDAYDRENHPVPLPDPIRAIEFHMDRLDLDVDDLESVFGSEWRARAVLQRQRVMSLGEIRRLSELLDIDIEVLAQEYELHCPDPVSETATLGNSSTRLIVQTEFGRFEATRSSHFAHQNPLRECIMTVARIVIRRRAEDVDTFSSEDQADSGPISDIPATEVISGTWTGHSLRIEAA